jgi:putative membrane protein
MWGEHEGMGWWMLFGSIWFVVFWGLIIWAFVSVVNRGDKRDSGDEPALDIARRRYARGEISREEFEQIRSDLAS